MKYDAIVIGDVHIKDHKWWRDYAHPLFFQWLSEIEANHYIFTGDFFDNTSPNWTTWGMAIELVSNLKGQVHIIQGNHEISNLKGNILPSFKTSVPNLEIYTEPTHVMITDMDFLMAPFLNGSRTKMIEYYNTLEDECDVIVAHVSPVGFNYGQEETDFPLVKTKWKCFGHIHNPNEDIVGVPVSTREGERGSKRVFGFKDGKRFEIPVPNFIEYVDVDYSDSIEVIPGRILNIKNAPSLQEAISKFSDHWIRTEGTTLLRTESDYKVSTVEDLSLVMADPKSFLHYANEDGISKEVIDRCLEAFSQ